MKVIILAGGLGTRISEETSQKPKPMVLIAGKPLLWHIMNVYAEQGFNDFVVASGYKGEIIQEWVPTIEENWSITVLDTGLETQTGGRIKKCIEKFSDETFLLTYGDGLANVNIHKLLAEHKLNKCLVTVRAVRPPARFGYLKIEGKKVKYFGEKNQVDEGWINGGFFVVHRKTSEYILSDSDPFEQVALPKLAKEELLGAFQHEGFWQPMDTLREKQNLEEFAKKLIPPWLESVTDLSS